jgi:predicted DCC family thiol-disulfide oxidoreductase YuxK
MASVAPAPGSVADTAGSKLVLYDGTCGLCSKSVRWILRHERDHELQFAPLQGPTAAALRERFPTIPADVETVVFVDGDRVHLRSKAFVHLGKHLRAPWRWIRALRWVPAFLFDLGYRVVAKMRYRIWGRVDACELPSPAERARFLP